jgi:hypothetical protein
MCVHLREAEVGDGRGLEGAQHLVPACLAGAKFLQQTDCFNGSHAPKIAQKPLAVTPESNGICGGHRLDTAVNKTPYSGKSRRASTGSSAGVRMASIFIFCRAKDAEASRSFQSNVQFATREQKMRIAKTELVNATGCRKSIRIID